MKHDRVWQAGLLWLLWRTTNGLLVVSAFRPSLTPTITGLTCRRIKAAADDDISSTTATATTEPSLSVAHSSFLGRIHPLCTGQEDDDSALAGAILKRAVPIFCAVGTPKPAGLMETTTPKLIMPDLAKQIGQEPAVYIQDVLPADTCQDLLDTCERQLGFGTFEQGASHHGALQMVVSQHTCDLLAERIRPFIDLTAVQARRDELQAATGGGDNNNNPKPLEFVGLNRRWRVYRYEPGARQRFAPHIDAGFPPSGVTPDGSRLIWDDSSPKESVVVSRLTVLFYLNDDFEGGETRFLSPRDAKQPQGAASSSIVVASVRPVAGACLIFPQAVGQEAVDYARQHWPMHEGSTVTAGPSPKYVIRSDILFRGE